MKPMPRTGHSTDVELGPGESAGSAAERVCPRPVDNQIYGDGLFRSVRRESISANQVLPQAFRAHRLR